MLHRRQAKLIIIDFVLIIRNDPLHRNRAHLFPFTRNMRQRAVQIDKAPAITFRLLGQVRIENNHAALVQKHAPDFLFVFAE